MVCLNPTLMANTASVPMAVSQIRPVLGVLLALRPLGWQALLRRTPSWAWVRVKHRRMLLLRVRLRKDSGRVLILVLITRIIGEVRLHTLFHPFCLC